MKKKVLMGLVVVFVVLIPFVINILLSTRIPEKWGYPIIGTSVDWLHFWASYLGATASFIMIVYTAMSLRQNQRQLEEMKRQWIEEHRARLVFSLACKERMIVLKVSNVGKETAYNIRLRFSDDFIDSLFVKYIRDLYISFKDKSFTIGACEDKFFFLSGTWGDEGVHQFYRPKESIDNSKFVEWLNSHFTMPITITGVYNDKYSVNEVLRLDEFFFNSLTIRDDLTNGIMAIHKGLVLNNNRYATIQESLDTIAKVLEQNQKSS